MNYEEKYKKALEKAKALYGSSEPMSGCSVILETIFPELKESEDEKIRKEIIDYIKTGTYHKSWIAWLEKQGGQEKDILEDAILDGNEDGLIVETIRYKKEKQSEQKSLDDVAKEITKKTKRYV